LKRQIEEWQKFILEKLRRQTKLQVTLKKQKKSAEHLLIKLKKKKQMLLIKWLPNMPVLL